MGALGAAPGVLSVLMTNSNILFVKFCLMKLSCPLMVLCLGDHWFCHLTVDVGVELPVLWLMQTRQSSCSDRFDTHLVSQSRWECGHSKWAHHGFSSLDTIRLSLRLFFFVLLITPFSYSIPGFSSSLLSDESSSEPSLLADRIIVPRKISHPNVTLPSNSRFLGLHVDLSQSKRICLRRSRWEWRMPNSCRDKTFQH